MKNTRNLRVYYTHQIKSDNNSIFANDKTYYQVPLIRLQGQWLQSAGFNPSDEIVITVSKGKIDITKK